MGDEREIALMLLGKRKTGFPTGQVPACGRLHSGRRPDAGRRVITGASSGIRLLSSKFMEVKVTSEKLFVSDRYAILFARSRGYSGYGRKGREIGRASCRERVCRTCRSRWSPYP